MIYALSLVVVLLDQITKIWIVNTPACQDLVLIPGFFHLTYLKNTGMAWSLLSGYTQVLSVISAAAVLFMIWIMETKKPKPLTKTALALMIGGAFGNMIDRLMLGYVRDFLDFYIFGYNFPVFNVADMALCIGVGLLILASVLEDEEKHGKNELDI